MSDYQSQEYTSAQPRPQQTPNTSVSSSPNPLLQVQSDDINTAFATLDSDLITSPYNADQATQPDFERSVADALMHLAMNIRAWSEARPAYEANREKTHLITEIQQIESREQEQGTSISSILESVRQRLVGFVASIKFALEDLQG